MTKWGGNSFRIMTHIFPAAAAAPFPLIFLWASFNILSIRGGKKASCRLVTFRLFDPAGVIPLNATPGKACGTTLTDICSTSEVSGWFFFFLFSTFFFSLFLYNLPKIRFFPPSQFYLSYHLYIVALAGAGATVIALVSCSDNPPLKICTLPWCAYLLPRQPHLSRKCVVLSAEILPRGLLCECVWVCVCVCERLCFTPLWRWTFVFCIQGNGDAKKIKSWNISTHISLGHLHAFCFLIF